MHWKQHFNIFDFVFVFSLSVEVLQGFTCSRVRTFTQTKITGLIKACRRRSNRPKVVLSETQVSADKNDIQTCDRLSLKSEHEQWICIVSNCFPSWLACTTLLERNHLLILKTIIQICCCTSSKCLLLFFWSILLYRKCTVLFAEVVKCFVYCPLQLWNNQQNPLQSIFYTSRSSRSLSLFKHTERKKGHFVEECYRLLGKYRPI